MTLHYTSAVPAAEGGKWLPQEMCGFDIADVSSTSKLNGMPEGVLGLVYVGHKNGADDKFRTEVDRWKGNVKVWGFYLVDEPMPKDVSPASVKAQADYIKSTQPGKIVYMKCTNEGTPEKPQWSYNPSNTNVDILGIGGYCVRKRFTGGYDPGLIERYVTSAVRDGIPLARISPCMQAFGGVEDWPMPTQAQMDEMYANWRRYVPNPVFDYVYSWGIQPAYMTQSLSNNAMLREATMRHFAAMKQPAGMRATITLDGAPVAEMMVREGSDLRIKF